MITLFAAPLRIEYAREPSSWIAVGRYRLPIEPVAVLAIVSAISTSGCSQDSAVGEFAMLTAGESHTCAISSTGQATCWGNNQFGQVGASGLIARNSKSVLSPAIVAVIPRDVVSISAGSIHTCAISTAAGTHCWGYNAFGLLGDGTTANRRGVVRVIEPQLQATSVSVGNGHACILTSNGAVYCWGRNKSGAVGDGSKDDRIVPTPVVGLSSGVVAMSAGGRISCAVTKAGNVLCWGHNYNQCIGDGTRIDRLVPTPVVGLELPVVAISAGEASVCAITSNQGVVCWGGYPRFGSGADAVDERLAPKPIPWLETGVIAVSSGNGHACAITDCSALKCWGYNQLGQLGDGTEMDREYPTQVMGLESNVIAVSAGSGHTCAVRAPGTALCWGSNGDGRFGRGVGRLGDGTSLQRFVPTPVQVSP
ncbi:MAG: hypothetical protein FWD57_14590 [Polyangiaceae bacterium]|nr:hypothetical protein [Polyangiaceae bacterium]